MERLDVVLDGRGGGARRSRLRWAGFAALLSFAIVAWEYLLNAAMNPVDWKLTGVAAHMALDLAMTLPVVAFALAAGLWLARRFGMATRDWSGLLGVAGLVSLIFLVAMAPIVGARDFAHEWMGNTYGLSLAEVQITQVRTDLTVQSAKQLCSFTSLKNPAFAGTRGEQMLIPMLFRVEVGVTALLVQMAAFLPFLLGCLFLRYRRELPQVAFERSAALLRWSVRPVRLAAVAVVGLLGFCYNGIEETHAQTISDTAAPYNACTDGGPVKEYKVHAINVVHTFNRYFDHAPGFMYALEANIPAIRAFEQEMINSRLAVAATVPLNVNLPGVKRVTPGLRKDPIQPLVIRGNLGDCVRIHFTNSVTDGRPTSIHILGLSHTVTNAGSAVGNNPSTFAASGQTITYNIPIPKDASAERAYFFHDHGAGVSPLNVGGRVDWRVRQGMGLFGALVAEPAGSTYLDVETGQPLNTVTGSSWEAIIIDPNRSGRADGKSFREFVIMYHEWGHENFRALFDFRGGPVNILPHLDPTTLSGAYRPGARAINYRSEPFRRRIELNDLLHCAPAPTNCQPGDIRNGKSLAYSSYPFGDPPTPIPRSYLGEATKTRVLHAGAEVFHVHHLHGGGDRWRRNPDADPNSNYWKGLTKVPQAQIKSIHLDSQSIGPGSTYNLEHECGAGGCQQGEGEFLFHCHVGHHYVAGMWSFWRVYATRQTAENEIHGHALFIEPRLFQADNPFSSTQAPSNTPPSNAVSAGQLIGVKVDWGRTIVADASFSNPLTQVKLSDWVKDQLPPQGTRLDDNDASVWDWTSTGSDATLKVFGEPEETRAMANWTSPSPGVRPEVKFNPKNGRYAWPLFRPHAAARPPFTARHSGSPWLGEQMIPGRMDGLCANNFVHPDVVVGEKAQRFFPVSAVTLPIQVIRADVPSGLPSATDPNGMLFVLNEHKADIFAGLRPKEPLAIRSNVGDCVEILFTNEIPDGTLNNNWSKVNIHSHFVQFDTQASDGVVSGFSYEQAVRPYATENRTLTQQANQFSSTLKVSNVNRLRPGVWIGIGLGEGTCGSLFGQPLPCTEVRQITSITAPDTINLNLPLLFDHPAGQAVGVEFVRYNWYSDVDFGTVFFHTHVDSKDWDHGLFGAHIVEPKGSTYHDPTTGAQIRAGTLADIHVDPTFGTQPVAAGVNGSFREFMLFVQNQNPVVGQFDFGGGTFNLRAEPWILRPGDPAYRFSSVQHGEPFTQQLRAYAGDPVVFRGLGLIEKVGGLRVTGHRFNIERNTASSDLRDATFLGISERFDFALEGGAGGPKRYAGDYLYYSTLAKDFESGAWGLMRVFDGLRPDLKQLPGAPGPSSRSGFPTLTAGLGTPPPSLTDGPGSACPAEVKRKVYNLSISDTNIIYNDAFPAGEPGVAYFLNGTPVTDTRAPMVVRVNKGHCLQINLTNLRTQRSGFSVGELISDPQRSYGTAIGLNYDSTVASGATRTYEYYADKELGLTMVLNLADTDSLARGAWGGVVVEPEGSTYRAPGTLNPLPGDGVGIQADIVRNGLATREFVALFMDAEDEFSQDRMPYPAGPEFTNSVSYSNEPFTLRNFLLDPTNVFSSLVWPDPRHVVTLPKGASLIYRAGQPWGEMPHMATLEGHRYRQESGMAGSEVLWGDVMASGMTLNMEYLGGAGGDLNAPGDYLFLDRGQPFVQTGLWHILRVTNPSLGGALHSGDRVTVTGVGQGGNGRTVVRGVVSTQPAGDTVGRLAVFDGPAVNGKCTGQRLGAIQVDRGNGRWETSFSAAQTPKHVCFQSPGGGVASGPTSDPVLEKTKKVNAAAEDVRRAKQLKVQLEQQFRVLEAQEASEE